MKCAIKCEVTAWVCEHQPHIVQVEFIDAWGMTQFSLEKSSLVSDEDLRQHSKFPQPGLLDCELVKEWQDETGRELLTINVYLQHSVDNYGEDALIDVLPEQVTPREPPEYRRQLGLMG